MEEVNQNTHTEVQEKTKESPNYTNGALVLVGTIAVIVLLKFLSNFAQKQKTTNQ